MEVEKTVVIAQRYHITFMALVITHTQQQNTFLVLFSKRSCNFRKIAITLVRKSSAIFGYKLIGIHSIVVFLETSMGEIDFQVLISRRHG